MRRTHLRVSAHAPVSYVRTTRPSRYARRSSASASMLAKRAPGSRAIAFSQIDTSSAGTSGAAVCRGSGGPVRTQCQIA